MKLKYPVGKTVARLVRHAWAENKALFFRFGVYTLAAAIYPMLAVALPKLILGELTQAAPSMERLTWIVVGFFLAAAATGYAAKYLAQATYMELCKLRLGHLTDMLTKSLVMRYSLTEDAGFYDAHEMAISANSSNGAGVEAVYHALFEMPAVLLASLVYVGLIGSKNLLLLAVVLLHVAAVFWASREAHAFRYSLKKEIGHEQRRLRYYRQTASDFSYGKDVRIYGFGKRILANFKQEIDAYVSTYKRIHNREFLLGFAVLGAMLLSDAVTYGILIRDVVRGMGIDDFSMYLAAAASLSIQLKLFAEKLGTIYSEGEYANEFFNLMDEDLNDPGGTLPAVANDTLEIQFHNVSFKYPNTEKYIFQNFNFTIHKGERLAVVGVNGAGKSTLVKLMTGLFAPTEGEITINGQPIGAYNKQALYSMFSVVFQDVNVFAFTLRENVSCRADGDRARVLDALDRAGLGEKVRALPKQEEQVLLKVLEEGGTELSGGEAQKLAIARALYKDANMVILDEPTAALDALAEAEIYKDFAALADGKTAVFISHRLASTKFCDHIALLDENGLAEYGTHEELMALGGKYYEMLTVQGRYYSEHPTEVGA